MHRETDRQTDRQTDTQTDTQTARTRHTKTKTCITENVFTVSVRRFAIAKFVG